MKRLYMVMLLFLLIISTVACSEIGLQDPQKDGAGIGSVFIYTPTSDEGGYWRIKRFDNS